MSEAIQSKNQIISFETLPPMLKISEVSQILGVIPLTLRKWDKQGKLVPIRIGKRRDRRYKREDILKIYKEGIE